MQQSPIADGDDTATTAEDVREEQAAEETTDPFELSEDPETDEFTSESSSYEPVFATTSPDNVPEQQQQPTLSPADEFIVETNAIEEAESITTDTYDPTAELSRFRFPSIDLLVDRAGNTVTMTPKSRKRTKSASSRLSNSSTSRSPQSKPLSDPPSPCLRWCPPKASA